MARAVFDFAVHIPVVKNTIPQPQNGIPSSIHNACSSDSRNIKSVTHRIQHYGWCKLTSADLLRSEKKNLIDQKLIAEDIVTLVPGLWTVLMIASTFKCFLSILTHRAAHVLDCKSSPMLNLQKVSNTRPWYIRSWNFWKRPHNFWAALRATQWVDILFQDRRNWTTPTILTLPAYQRHT